MRAMPTESPSRSRTRSSWFFARSSSRLGCQRTEACAVRACRREVRHEESASEAVCPFPGYCGVRRGARDVCRARRCHGGVSALGRDADPARAWILRGLQGEVGARVAGGLPGQGEVTGRRRRAKARLPDRLTHRLAQPPGPGLHHGHAGHADVLPVRRSDLHAARSVGAKRLRRRRARAHGPQRVRTAGAGRERDHRSERGPPPPPFRGGSTPPTRTAGSESAEA